MPKKSKVNKLARMSDEERARYLQHRADNKLDKEEKYSKTNTAKINEAWRFILRKIKNERNISNNQDQAEFKLVLIKFIQQRDFENYNKEKENESATVKNDARLE
ncbi:unnamed protein product, partial [Leptidea sinapis]